MNYGIVAYYCVVAYFSWYISFCVDCTIILNIRVFSYGNTFYISPPNYCTIPNTCAFSYTYISDYCCILSYKAVFMNIRFYIFLNFFIICFPPFQCYFSNSTAKLAPTLALLNTNCILEFKLSPSVISLTFANKME